MTSGAVLKLMMEKKNVDGRSPRKNTRAISMKYELKFQQKLVWIYIGGRTVGSEGFWSMSKRDCRSVSNEKK